MPIIKVNNLSKTFTYHKKAEGLKGSLKAVFWRKKLYKQAVKNVSFSINKGEFVGFLGPNGAGKTTTLKMLSGILYPTGGDIDILGYNPAKRQRDYKKQFSIVMGQKSQLWPTLPAMETFRLLQKIYEVNDTKFDKQIKKLTKLMDISDLINVQVRKLSLGQRMKAEIVAALIHDPKILFLDEPTIGLDVVSQRKLREFLKKYNEERKTTIILTSHYMDDVQDLCKRIIIINDGQVGYDGSLNKIITDYSNDKEVKIKFEKAITQKDIKIIGKIKNFSPYEVELSIDKAKVNDGLAILFKKFKVKDISIADVTLDEVVVDLFSK